VFFVASGVPPLEVREGSESAEFVSQGSSAVEDGLHLVGVDGVGRRVAGGILEQCIGLGQGIAAIEGGKGAINA
jgi:hypothetical protein